MGFDIAELTKDGDFKIRGNLNTRLPIITEGLVAHFPFDKSMNHFKSIKGSKILIYCYSAADRPIFNWLALNGANLTEVNSSTILSYTTNDVKNYDLIIYDCYVWSVPSAHILKIKEFVDSGVSVFAMGNDSTTNHFVKTYSAGLKATHSITIDENCPIDFGFNTILLSNSEDLDGGISELQNGAFPIYRRSDTNNITGYMYQNQENGAVFIFDQEGIVSYSGQQYDIIIRPIIEYALENSMGGITNTNTILTSDGIAVEEATTNLWTANGGVNLTSISKYGQTIETTYNVLQEKFLGTNILRVTRGNGSTYWNQTSMASDTVNGTTWTWSIYARPVYRDINLRLNTDEGSSPTILCKRGQWSRLVLTFNTKATNRWLSPAGWNVNDVVDFAAPLLEQKSFATSFVNGDRPSYGLVEINNLNLNIFTLAFKFKPDVQYYNIMTGSYNKVMLTMYDTDLIRRIHYTDYTSSPSPSATRSDPFFDLEPSASWSIANHWHQYYSYKANKWHYFFFMKSGNILRVYITSEDGTLLKDQTFIYSGGTDLENFTLSKLTLGSSASWSGIFKDVSLYNRQLSDNEIKELYHPKFGLKYGGDLIVPKIKSKPIIPEDVVFFPLDNNGNDEYNTIYPTTESNTVYEDGACWVGVATTNLCTKSDFSSGWGYYNGVTISKIQIPFITGLADVLQVNYSGTGDGHIGYNMVVTGAAGKDFTLSFWIKADKDTPMLSSCFLQESAAPYKWLGPSKTFLKLPTEWTKVVLTGTTPVDCLDTIRIVFRPSSDATNSVYYTQPQLEQRGYVTPFTSGTRAATQLYYSPTLINCAQNFTIFGWYNLSYIDSSMYEGLLAHDDGGIGAGNGGRFLVMGNTSENRIRWWYGNGTNETSLSTNAPDFVVGQWCFFAVRRNGNITTLFDSRNGILYSASGVNGTYLDTMTYINPWRFGMWNTSQPARGFIKNYGFIQRALADNEIKGIFEDGMEYSPDKGLQIKHLIKTRQVIE